MAVLSGKPAYPRNRLSGAIRWVPDEGGTARDVRLPNPFSYPRDSWFHAKFSTGSTISALIKHDPPVPGDFEQILDHVRQRLGAIEVAPHEPDRLTYSADREVVDSNSVGFARAGQAVAAVQAPSTRRAEYEQTWGNEFVRLLVAVHPITTKRWRFLLVVLAFGFDDQKREVVAAFRLYPSAPDEGSELLDDPGFALATLISKYGTEYETERGEPSIFEPSVEFERQRFVRSDRVELSEVNEALGFDYHPDALVLLVVTRLKQGGGVRLFFPIMLRTDGYRDDVEAASG